MIKNLRNALLPALAVLLLCTLVHGEVLQEVIVKDGDTLWGVANYYLKDPQRWPEILKYNSILSSDPNVILPGMKLRVPILLIKENLRAARLMYALNDVRYRRKSGAEWSKAWVDMELYNEDGLRTLQMSRAKVKFPSGEVLQLDENSLIILRPEKSREEVDLLSGGVRASKTKILSSDSIVDPRIEPRSVMPDFKTKIKEDKTTLVEVYEGIVDVRAQGKTVTVTKGFGAEVKFRQPPSLPRALPPRPNMDLNNTTAIPGTDYTAAGKVTSRSLELDIRVPQIGGASVQDAPASSPAGREDDNRSHIVGQIINKYHLQFSTSPSFGSLIIDEVNTIRDKVNIDFKKYQLMDGVYYYRFAYVDELGLEGQYCPAVQFTIDTTAPVLEITSPENEDEIDAEFIHVEGNTEPKIRLKVNDKNVAVDDLGKFTTALIPVKGWNQIILVAEDEAGNVTKKELAVNKVKVAREKKTTEHKKSREKETRFISGALGIVTGVVILGVILLLVG